MTPDAYTIKETFIEVGDGHTLYVHDWGNSKAKTPIVFLHGGPGSGCNDKHKGIFDGARQRVIFFDQRGSGKSLPLGSLKNNDTEHLIKDIVTVTDKLGAKKFILYGGSWGSALALAFGIAHPDKVAAMVLHGIWTCSEEEISWVDQGKFKTFFPDLWEEYLEATPKEYRKDPSAYHFNRVLNSDVIGAKESAFAYENLEGGVIQLDDRRTPENFEEYDPTNITIEIHYLANRCFMADRFIMNNVHKIKAPVYLVQGRYDMVCPPQAAYELNQKLSNSELIWTTSGHKAERESWSVMRQLLLNLSK